MVLYDFSFQFEEGLYLDFSSVKTNSPLPYERIVEPIKENDNFFELLNEVSIIKYYDNFGVLQEINKSDIWGYCKNGKPYIYWSDKFNLIPYIGSISLFVTTVKISYSTGGAYDPFYGPYYYSNNTYQTEELRQFIVDFESGKVYYMDYKNVELLLSKTPELQKEFSKLSKRKKNKKLINYIRIYNEQIPLYVSKN